MSGGSLLVDPSISSLHPHAIKTIGLGSIIGSWIVYDGIWRSPLGKQAPRAATLLSIAGLFAAAYGLTQFLSGRAAFLHVGVIMGTCMTGNVWMTIVPSQRELVQATEQGRDQDKSLSLKAKQRSIHNNYMTFPLLFIMVSNHFPAVTGAKLGWAALLVIMIAGAGVRHYMNIRWTYPAWFPAAASLVIFGTIGVYMLTARWDVKTLVNTGPPVSFAAARMIVEQRCTTCHAENPTDDTWKAAPSGVMLDTPERIKLMAPRIRERAVVLRNMPLANKTHITDEEHEVLGRWIDQGAPIQLGPAGLTPRAPFGARARARDRDPAIRARGAG